MAKDLETGERERERGGWVGGRAALARLLSRPRQPRAETALMAAGGNGAGVRARPAKVAAALSLPSSPLPGPRAGPRA